MESGENGKIIIAIFGILSIMGLAGMLYYKESQIMLDEKNMPSHDHQSVMVVASNVIVIGFVCVFALLVVFQLRSSQTHIRTRNSVEEEGYDLIEIDIDLVVNAVADTDADLDEEV